MGCHNFHLHLQVLLSVVTLTGNLTSRISIKTFNIDKSYFVLIAESVFPESFKTPMAKPASQPSIPLTLTVRSIQPFVSENVMYCKYVMVRAALINWHGCGTPSRRHCDRGLENVFAVCEPWSPVTLDCGRRRGHAAPACGA